MEPWPAFPEMLSAFGSPRFPRLRPAQDVVLAEYLAEHRETRDLAIELPTGAGKSLIALLIGEAWRRSGRTVAVLTGNKVLARDMEEQGRDLGVPVERMEGGGDGIPLAARRRYRRGNAIAVMNYWVMFNSNPVIDSADLLIIDDAHLAEGALENLFSVQIDRFTHPTLFGMLAGELSARLPDYASLRDAAADEPSGHGGVELMSFLDQDRAAPRLRELVDGASELSTDIDLRFRWGRVRERLDECNVYTSQRAITIRPYCLPVQTLSRWSDPAQRLYLSATIGDPGDLQRRLGSAPITKIGSDADAPTLGRRLIILNNDVEAEGALPSRVALTVTEALRVHPKAVWLCASKAQADAWQAQMPAWLAGHGVPDAPVWRVGRGDDEIEQFRAAPSGHLFAAGRFDGMDFAGAQCRLVVLTTLPRAINEQEQFVSDYLRDASFLIGRTNQRITQALGRCNRREDDHAVYVLADRRLAAHLGQEANRRGLPRALQAELDLAEDLDALPAEQLAAETVRFLNGDFNYYDTVLAELAADVPAPAPPPSDDADDEVTGWLALHGRQDYLTAEARFAARQQQLSALGLRELGGFTQYTEAKAAHLEGRRGDAAASARSRTALEQAIGRGGASSTWFNRLRSSLSRDTAITAPVTTSGDEFRSVCARAFDVQLESTPPGAKLDKWRLRLAERLASDKHDVFAQGVGQLGELLGYTALFPKYGAATDCRWQGVFGNAREAITFEAKIEHGRDTEIDAHAVGQAHNQKARAESELGAAGFTVRGLVVTHLERLAADAAASLADVVILRRDAVEALHQRVDQLLVEFSMAWSLVDPRARVEAGEALAAKLPDTGWLVAAIDGGDRFLAADELLSAWSR
jgi:hypothetical protein